MAIRNRPLVQTLSKARKRVRPSPMSSVDLPSPADSVRERRHENHATTRAATPMAKQTRLTPMSGRLTGWQARPIDIALKAICATQAAGAINMPISCGSQPTRLRCGAGCLGDDLAGRLAMSGPRHVGHEVKTGKDDQPDGIDKMPVESPDRKRRGPRGRHATGGDPQP